MIYRLYKIEFYTPVYYIDMASSVAFPFGGIDMYDICGGSVKYKGTRKNKHAKSILIKMFIDKGWEPHFVRMKFLHLDDRILKEWAPTLFIEYWAKHYIQTVPLQPTFKNTLLSLGFTLKMANTLVPICRSLVGSSYTYSQIIDIVIEYAVGRYTPIEWTYFIKEVYALRFLTIHSICSIALESEPELQTFLHTIHVDKESTDLYFHTTSWCNCLQILDGISHGVGRPCLDFGLLPGFYMSQDIRVAIEFGSKINKLTANQVGILIFRLPKQYTGTLKKRDLVGDDWALITQASRLCIGQQRELKQLRGFDFVYGDMVSNPDGVKNGQRPKTHSIPKKQLVGKTAKADIYLQENLVACIGFNPL